MFMALLDVTIVNIAMPAIITDLDATVSQASWVLNSYNLVLAVFFLSMGRVADRYGQKRVFIFGLVTFTLFSLLCGFAPNIEWLIAFRAGQGLGGAALLTISLAIVLGAFPSAASRARPSASGARSGTAAAAVGPVLGGVLVTYGHWSWIFFVNVPIGIVAVDRLRADHPARRAQASRPRAASTSPAWSSPAPASSASRSRSSRATPGAGRRRRSSRLFVGRGRELPAVHVVGDRTRRRRCSRSSLLRIRSFTAANTAVMFVGLAMGGTFLMLVLFLVSVLGYSELRAARRP